MKKKITFNLSTQRECMWANAFWPSAAKSCERGSFLALGYNPELPWHGKDKKVENIERKHM